MHRQNLTYKEFVILIMVSDYLILSYLLQLYSMEIDIRYRKSLLLLLQSIFHISSNPYFLDLLKV